MKLVRLGALLKLHANVVLGQVTRWSASFQRPTLCKMCKYSHILELEPFLCIFINWQILTFEILPHLTSGVAIFHNGSISIRYWYIRFQQSNTTVLLLSTTLDYIMFMQENYKINQCFILNQLPFYSQWFGCGQMNILMFNH